MDKKIRIVTLIEDTPGERESISEHGLSFYVETPLHKLMVDAGPSESTLVNAEKFGINLQEVDTLILSHGHYDHSGGIIPFSRINGKAAVLLQSSALGDYYNGERYIGIDKRIADLPNAVICNGDKKIDNELSLFTNISGRRLWPESNLILSEEKNGVRIQDSFMHEQCLVINACKKTILLSGCAHNGILNILDKFNEIYNRYPDCVFSGFHMMKKTPYEQREIETIQAIAKELKDTPTVYYSGHCTGIPAFDIMKEIMEDKLVPIHSGSEFII